jgi:hypothetical protein
MKAIVVYPKNTTFQVDVPDIITNIPDCLDFIHLCCEPDSGNPTIRELNRQGGKLRSAMVGDLYMVHSRFFMVDSCGFVEITESQFLMLQYIPDRDRLMGWDWLRQHHNLGLHIQCIT